MTCFLCRNKGHSIKSCPKAEGNQSTAVVESDPAATDATAATSGICYKCGSSQHTSSKCTKLVDPKNPYPFAHCFVCNNKGHLAGQCEKNDRGLYPNGGSCKYCGSVRHFAKDCKPSNQGTWAL
ncbi:hypothetical protein BC832DRAFT_531692 [Gaertneriomyces semiglobifer]|nr:hypothetical protein BC832DRAFT_531692 [Gaertneriomyces semiglobifer]